MRKDFNRTLYRVLARLSGRVSWKWVSRWKVAAGMSLLASAGGAAAGEVAPVREAACFPDGVVAVVDSLARADGVVFEKVEEEPVCPEGNVMAHVRERTEFYPAEALGDGVTGRVIVGFTVDEQGRVTDVEVVRGLHPVLDSNAMAIVAGLPTFLPGRQGGKPVKVKGTLAIDYTAAMQKRTKIFQESMCYWAVEEENPWEGLRNYICRKVVYPEEAMRKGIKGNVYVGVTIRADGSVTDERIVRGAHPLLDAEALRVVRELPRWEPAKIEGRAVDETYVVTIPFDPDYLEKKPWAEVFLVVEEMPEFPEGDVDSYLASQTHYPTEAKRQGIEGKVFVQFIIEPDGSLKDVKVLRPVHPLLDEEALRVVREMPRWKPGRHVGKPVRMLYTVVVRFDMDK